MKYKRIFSRGHCSIYQNLPEVNSLYRTLPACSCQEWKTVFQSEKACCFDEWAGHCGGGLSQIMQLNNVKMFDEVFFADINVNSGRFEINRMKKYKNPYFIYEKGSLKGSDVDKEVLYAHFQKREVKIEDNINYNEFYFVAPGFITSNVDKVKHYIVQERLFEIKRFRKRLQNKVDKVLRRKQC